jgi:hypothetical protein
VSDPPQTQDEYNRYLAEFRDSLAPPRYGWSAEDVPAQGYVHGLDPAEDDPRRVFP